MSDNQITNKGDLGQEGDEAHRRFRSDLLKEDIQVLMDAYSEYSYLLLENGSNGSMFGNIVIILDKQKDELLEKIKE